MTNNTNPSWGDGIPPSDWVKITPGGHLRLKVLDRTIRPSNLRKDRDGRPLDEVVATVEVDGVTKAWTPNVGALRALEAARVANGDTIDVERGADTVGSSGYTVSNWTVAKVEPADESDNDNVIPF
jgi:hypothetical protein